MISKTIRFFANRYNLLDLRRFTKTQVGETRAHFSPHGAFQVRPMTWVYLIISFLLVGFGQPAWIPEAGLLAAAGGYALFWKAMLQCRKRCSRFFLAVFWFMAVHAIQLSWMTSTQYMGPFILVVYGFLLVGLGLQFGLFSLLLSKSMSQFHCVALAGGFVLLEWMRLFLFTGFTWNPAGLALGGSIAAIQLASFLGIYGLSFWVIWTNLGALSLLERPSGKRALIWATLVLFPYGFGLVHENWVKRSYYPFSKPITAALIDTNILVEEKHRDHKIPQAFIPPLAQWERVWSYLSKDRRVDLIVLPEGAFPYGVNNPFCPVDLFKERWELHFGNWDDIDLPPLESPYADLYEVGGQSHWIATNAFFAQVLANQFHADVIVGLACDDGKELQTNSAFLFRPHKDPQRYDKRILVPIGEYIPLQNIRLIADFISREYGIAASFDVGKEAKVLRSHLAIGVPICLEEMHSELVRDIRSRGADLLVSLSNDVWFPSSRLAKQHFEHGKIRAVENGIFLLRSSNKGISGGVDCFGRSIGIRFPGTAGAIYLSIPIFSYSTLYSLWGDRLILSISSLSFLIFIGFQICHRKRRKSCS